MRIRDRLELPLAALWQQKGRTILTTLGVVFGSFVLAASLSIGQGVQDTIERESRRRDVLRKVSVWAGHHRPEPKPVDDEIEIEIAGTMSEARRERIRREIRRQQTTTTDFEYVRITREMAQTIREMPFVEAVIPHLRHSGFAQLEGRVLPAELVVASSRPEDPAWSRRLIAGRRFSSPSERAVIVSELLLYRWGIFDEVDVEEMLGRTVQVELHQQPVLQNGLFVYLRKPRGGPTPEEQAATDKISSQLPGALDRFDLDNQDIAALKSVISEAAPEQEGVFTEAFTIVGVKRAADETELKEPWTALDGDAEVMLPYDTAAEFFLRQPWRAEHGFDQITVIVDRDEHTRETYERIRKLGLQAHAPIEFVERERMMNRLIFSAMSCVAGVALLVAALGMANTMLMSVLERTREIGIMKAVGAGNGELMSLFLVEGALIGLGGGILGLLLAWGASIPGDAWVRASVAEDVRTYLTESIFVFPSWLIAAVPVFASLVTTLAALSPARRVARIDPVAALRHE